MKGDDMAKKEQAQGSVGKVMVVGAGVAGVQAALDLVNAGFYVYLVEKKSAIGGVVSQLDRSFPTNESAMCVICMMSPNLLECGRSQMVGGPADSFGVCGRLKNIEILTLSSCELRDYLDLPPYY